MRKLEKNRVFEGNLILVNQNYPLRCTIAAKNLCPVFENQSQILMQQECAGMLDKLFQELNWSISEEIYQLIVGVSGYRTKSEQEEIFDDSLKENGRAFTEKYVAFPDHSEHQTGLAIDLAENREEIDFIRPQFPYQGICQKFREKIADFGFIERYPKENDIDLIIIGATGLNVVGRLLVGSTAAYTIREAPCDVTVVKTNLKNQKLDIKETTYPEM